MNKSCCEDERWAWIPGLEGRYEASTCGRVRSWITAHGLRVAPMLLSPHKGRGAGYTNYMLAVECGRYKRIDTHRIVLLTFREEPEDPNYQGSHLDHNKKNAHLSNLIWESPKANLNRSIKAINSGIAVSGCHVGERNANAKLSAAAVAEIRRASAAGTRMSDLARRYSVGHSAISSIVKGRSWKHLNGASEEKTN